MSSIIKVNTIKDTSDNTLLTSSSGNVSISNDLTVDTSTLYVDSTNNNVGIGTTSPTKKLQVNGNGMFVSSTSLRIDVDDGAGPVISQQSSSADTLFIRSFGNIELQADSNNNSGQSIIFKEGNIECMRLGASEVVINEGSVDYDFRVESNTNTHALFVNGANDGVVHMGGTSNTGYSQTSGTGQLAYRIDNGANYGSLILSNNADNNWSAMYINKFSYTSGDDQRYINWWVNGSNLASIQLNSAGTQVEYNTSSDRRLKENIVDIEDGIIRLKQLKPRKYTWTGTDFLAEGFIADEADGIVPEAVKGEVNAVDDNGNPVYQQIEYSKYVPLLTASLKEAIAKIEELETRIETLENV